MFGEKKTEFYKGSEVEVWQSPKYLESKAKAIEMIESKKYGLVEGDFWILMNATKSGKMAYTGLILSHNGCLKINDKLEDNLKVKPECISLDRNGYNNSLVYTYCCPEQGLYEVGEVNEYNCKNEYPYAMALKRCQDRVILKNSKLAFYGIYSDVEAEEFKQKIEEVKPKPLDKELQEQAIALGINFDNVAKHNNVSVDYLTDEMLKKAIEMKINYDKCKNDGEVRV